MPSFIFSKAAQIVDCAGLTPGCYTLSVRLYIPRYRILPHTLQQRYTQSLVSFPTTLGFSDWLVLVYCTYQCCLFKTQLCTTYVQFVTGKNIYIKMKQHLHSRVKRCNLKVKT